MYHLKDPSLSLIAYRASQESIALVPKVLPLRIIVLLDTIALVVLPQAFRTSLHLVITQQKVLGQLRHVLEKLTKRSKCVVSVW